MIFEAGVGVMLGGAYLVRWARRKAALSAYEQAVATVQAQAEALAQTGTPWVTPESQAVAVNNATNPAAAGHVGPKYQYPMDKAPSTDNADRWAKIVWEDGCWEVLHLEAGAKWESGRLVLPSLSSAQVYARGTKDQQLLAPGTFVGLPITASGLCLRGQAPAPFAGTSPTAAQHVSRTITYPLPNSQPESGALNGDGKGWAMARWADGCWELWRIPHRNLTSGFIPDDAYVHRRGTAEQSVSDASTVVNLTMAESGKCGRKS